eukprot:PhF_6_TR43001/c0_g2_i1/m.65655
MFQSRKSVSLLLFQRNPHSLQYQQRIMMTNNSYKQKESSSKNNNSLPLLADAYNVYNETYAAATYNTNNNNRNTVNDDGFQFPSTEPVYTRDIAAEHVGRMGEVRRLSKKESDVIWNQRNQQFMRMQRQIFVTVTSHLSIENKCLKLLELYREVKVNNLQLRAQTYEDIFEVFLQIPYNPYTPYPFTEQLFDMYHTLKGSFFAPTQKI